MKYIQYEKKENIGIATINRPEALNAINHDVMAELGELCGMVEADPELGALIITGTGKSFVAGADIATMQPLTMMESRDWSKVGVSTLRRFEQLPVPTIAAVNGYALGGGTELAMACDIIVCSDKARFGQPEVNLGIIPGFSGTIRLPRRIPVGMAKEMIYTGRHVFAEEAKEIGLVNHIYPAEELMDKAFELAKSITKNAPVAVKFAKQSINRGLQTDIDSAVLIEEDLETVLFGTEDQKEGMKAFLEKRPATFKGK